MEWIQLWQLHGLALLTGSILDWIFGDPYHFPHMIRLMGNMISGLEKRLRKLFLEKPRFAGICLTLIMCLFWIIMPGLLFHITGRYLGLTARFILESFFCYQLLAAKSLCVESMKVCKELKKGDTEGARKAVSMIVGRDTSVLDTAGITRAAVETVAENTSDGVIAPFLFMAIFGPVGGTFYKAVNTMDSMIGYTNDKYILFGRTAAKLDDVLNFIPARISGCLLTLAAYLLPGADGKNAWRIFLRDRRKHASPNSAHGEAACAGALHLRLAGDAWYFGVLHKKQFIGDNDREIVPEDIWKASLLMFLAEGILLENAVYLELRRLGYIVYTNTDIQITGSRSSPAGLGDEQSIDIHFGKKEFICIPNISTAVTFTAIKFL